MSNGYRTLSQHLADLKKENFSLKLRIYFLEEHVQQKFEASSEDVHRRNIELKVEAERLKRELQEKEQLLNEALTTVGCLNKRNENDLQQACGERRRIDRDVLEEKLGLLRGEATLGWNECVTAETKDREKDERAQALQDKEAQVGELREERVLLQKRVADLENQVLQLGRCVQQKVRDAEEELDREKLRVQQEMQSLIKEQQSQLNQYENAAGRCVSELQKSQLRAQDLQVTVNECETKNKELRQKLRQVEAELRNLQQESRQQRGIAQGLNEAVSAREDEAQELHRSVAEQNETIFALRESTLQQAQKTHGDAESAQLVALRGSLFSAQLELQKSRRAQQHIERREAELSHSHNRIEGNLQEALQHREATERHNQELRNALCQARSDLQAKEAQLREKESEAQLHMVVWEEGNQQLRLTLQEKVHLIQEYAEMLDNPQDGSARDVLLDKLKGRIWERDKALERSIDEKFHCLEEKEEEVQRLRMTLRDKDRDLERLRCTLSHNEQMILSLEKTLRVKNLELERTSEANGKLRWLKQETNVRHARSLEEREALIAQLQECLEERAKEAQQDLLGKVSSGHNDVVEHLKFHLQLKDKLLQEVLSDRTQQAREHEADVQELLGTIDARDQYLQESTGRLGQVICEREGELQELRRQLTWLEKDAEKLRGRLTENDEEEPMMVTPSQGCSSWQEEERPQHGADVDLHLTQRIKVDAIKELQRLRVEPADPPLVEQLAVEIQELRSREANQKPSGNQVGGLSSEEGEEEDGGCDGYADDVEGEDVDGTARAQAAAEDAALEGRGLMELQSSEQRLVEQATCRRLEECEKEAGEELETPAKPGPNRVNMRHDRGKRTRIRPRSLDLGALLESSESQAHPEGAESGFWQHVEAGLRQQTQRLRGELALARQESRQLQETLTVCEATVQAQAEQLKDYRELLAETSVQQDSKQVQVDLQDLGYETCGRSENEAEREEASSPELDDMELCPRVLGQCEDAAVLQGRVEELRAELSRARRAVRGLQARIRSLSATSDYSSSLERPAGRGGDLRELVSRVASLEERLRSPRPENRKYDALIQAQARELSHLRQRGREGRGLCHLLRHHLGDVTKAFEELLRANDVDYYMGQSFRQQLAQGASLARRIASKVSSRGDRSSPEEDAVENELQPVRLWKDVRHKDAVIGSLHAKVQHSDTPSSSPVPSESDDRSDGTFSASDEHGSTHSDLEADSDVEVEQGGSHTEASTCGGDLAQHFSSPSGLMHPQAQEASFLLPRPIHRANIDPVAFESFSFGNGAFSLAGAQQELQTSHRQLGRSFSFPSASYIPLSHQQHQLWDAVQPQQGNLTPNYCCGPLDGNSMEEHLRQARELRQRLEDSIRANEQLRHQLQERLTVGPMRTYSQELESLTIYSKENQALKGEVLHLQAQLQASRESCKEAELLQAEAKREARQWKEDLGRLQEHSWAQAQEIQRLQRERQAQQEVSNRVQHEARLLRQQLCENQRLLRSHKQELQVYEQVCHSTSGCRSGLLPRELKELLVEVRTLRTQLLHSALRAQLAQRPLSQEEHTDQAAAPKQQETDCCKRSRLGDDLGPLRQQILEGKALAHRMEAALQAAVKGQPLEHGGAKGLLSSARTLQKILEEAANLLTMFCKDVLPTRDIGNEHATSEEMQQLRQKVHEQEELLKSTVERLKSTSGTKETMENFIISQLSRTRDVLHKARTNIEENQHKLSALCSSTPGGSSKADVPRSPWVSHSDWITLDPAWGIDENSAGQCLLGVVAY